jgi:hypothetical protein
MGAGQGQWRTRAGDLNASHLNRNREIQASAQGAPSGYLNTFHLIRDRGIPWAEGKENWGAGLEISTRCTTGKKIDFWNFEFLL